MYLFLLSRGFQLSFLKYCISSVFLFLLVGCYDEVTYLEQGWTEENQLRQLSYSTSQGSQLIPYEWFLHLEVPGSNTLLRSDAVIEKLRYLPAYSSDPDYNPDGLPIGFVKDSDPQTGDWISLNCAACHTGQIDIGLTAVRIDGAPGMGDYIGLLKSVRKALSFTLKHEHKLRRFARNVIGPGWQTELPSLKQQIHAQVTIISTLIKNTQDSEHIAGFGRLDAFGGIANQIGVVDLGLEENFRPATAPVSYPFLWDAARLDRVQWTGHVDKPFGRNVGAVLGALGKLNLKDPEHLFESSVRGENIFLLEQWLAELAPPRWPEDLLGPIDQQAALRGRELYTANDASGYSCQSCHGLKDQMGDYPLTPASQNLFGKQFIKTVNIPLAEVGTDPNMLMNLYDQERSTTTGILAPLFDGQTQVQGTTFLPAVVEGTIGKIFSEMAPPLTEFEMAAYLGFRVNTPDYTPPVPVVGYKARPLAGIWATAPYLHNGSIPNLYELLLPKEQRSSVFWVGGRQFDSNNIGFIATRSPYSFKFDTSLSGNKNTGHLYGTTLDHDERMDLIEFLKTL